jgi:hypothetical protein
MRVPTFLNSLTMIECSSFMEWIRGMFTHILLDKTVFDTFHHEPSIESHL